MAHLISGQEYRDEAIIAEKIANNDFDVYVSPEFTIDGETYRVVMDGHHSYDAAIAAGVEPNIIEQTATDNDKIGLLLDGNIDDFLLVSLVDLNQYVFVSTTREVW